MDYSFKILHQTELKEIDEITEMQSIERIEKACQVALREIQEIREKLFQQVVKMQSLEISKQIIITRRAERWGKKKVEIYVRLEETREIEGYTRKNTVYQTSRNYNGNEKKLALEYAEELKKQYNVPIIKENWK